MKERHDGDCSIFTSLVDETPEAGICNCGYGLQCLRKGDPSEMYSKELSQKLEDQQVGRDLQDKLR